MKIKEKMYEISGRKIMLDRDLASFIGYSTKVLNQLVRRDISKFEKENYFQVNYEEFDILKSQLVTSNLINHGGIRYLPYVFSREGIKVLSVILKRENSLKVIYEILVDTIFIAKGMKLFLTYRSIFYEVPVIR